MMIRRVSLFEPCFFYDKSIFKEIPIWLSSEGRYEDFTYNFNESGMRM